MNEIQEKDKEKRIIVGITHGDINSINYELIIKIFQDARMLELFTPVVYGLSKIASYHRKTLNISDFTFNIIRKAEQAHPRKPNLINLVDQEIKIDLGKSTEIAGEMAFMALEAATDDLASGQIDVLVTAPINKKNIQSSKFSFPGHTEYLAQKFNTRDYLMLMVGNSLRVGVVTGHKPLKDVPGLITQDLVLNKIEVMNRTLIRDFNIRKPRIAVLGLNPHAGDDGLLGDEEIKVISPAIQKALNQGILAFGPFPADGFFGFEEYTHFDGILAMYHDQGLIAFKTLSYGEGVNYTAGLPVVRTSPAHGTAYDLAGKDLASPDSLRAAIYLGIDIYRNRKQNEELSANALHFAPTENNEPNS